MNSTGYGPSNQWKNITFDGDERKFELWEIKFLGYMKIRKLKHILTGEDEDITPDQNETAFAELIQFLDERSISLIMRDARDDGRKAFQILKEHYAGSGKPRIISLYTQLTALKKKPNELMTDYILRAESDANALRNAKEVISDGLLVAMVVKGHQTNTNRSLQSQPNQRRWSKTFKTLKRHELTMNKHQPKTTQS